MAKILDYRDESDPKQWGRLGGRRRHAEDPLRMVTEEENTPHTRTSLCQYIDLAINPYSQNAPTLLHSSPNVRSLPDDDR